MKKRIFSIFILICFILVLILCVNTDDTEETTNSETDNEIILYAGIIQDITTEMSVMSQNITQIVTAEVPFEEHYMYTNCNVNMRTESNTESEIIDTLMPNVFVKVCSIENDWSYVSVDDTCYGYIKSEYLSTDETPITSLNRWGLELTEEEINLLARIVYLEAGIDSLIGKEAVVESIFNRMAFSDNFRGNLYTVLSTKGQYNTWKYRNDNKCNPGLEEYEAIYNVLYGRTNILEPEYVYFSRTKANGHDFIKVGKHWFGKE